jgi:hypothetical protein
MFRTATPAAAERFFYSRYTNNFSVVLVNRSFNLDALKTSRRTLLEHLNQASYTLQAYVDNRLSDPRLSRYVAAEEQEVLSQLCQNWRRQIELGNSFLTYDYAEMCLAILAKAGYPLYEQLRSARYRAIGQRFVSVPHPSKAFVRISAYPAFDALPEALDRLVEELSARPLLLRHIERIEMARTDFPLKLETGATDYPTFSLFLDQHLVQTREHPLIDEAVMTISKTSDGLAQRAPQADYSHAVTPTLRVSQGFRNYKKYLHILGLLDTVYDRDSHYAYLH